MVIIAPHRLQTSRRLNVIAGLLPHMPDVKRILVDKVVRMTEISPITGASWSHCYRRGAGVAHWPALARLVHRFRSSHPIAAHPFANFGIKGALATHWIPSAALNLKFLNVFAAMDRNFKFAALGDGSVPETLPVEAVRMTAPLSAPEPACLRR